MSTNSECLFFKWEEGKWYYLLENYNAPKNAWDWRENATCYGPFATFDLAQKDLSKNHANPGGWSVNEQPDKTSPILIEHVKNARVMRQSFYRW